MALDVNGDKRISRKEFEKISLFPEHADKPQVSLSRLFDTVDLDRDETITFDEFLEHMSKHLPWVEAGISQEAYEALVADFTTLDANGDRKLNRKEFENFSRLPGYLGMQPADVSHLFSTVDADCSGAITLTEFVKYMSKRKDDLPLPTQVDPQKGCLEKNMARLGFELSTTDGGRKGVMGDGNCQFYSISWQLHKTTGKHKEVRSSVVNYLRGPGRANFSVFYAPSHPSQPETFDGYLDTMAKDKTWGDQLTLQAAANVFEMKVFVLTADQFNASARPILVLNPQKRPNAAKKTIWISFAALHYSPIDPTARTPKDLAT